MLKFYNQYFKFNKIHQILLLILLIDFIYIFVDIAVHYYVHKNNIDAQQYWGQFYVTSESEWAEMFQYFKYIIIVITTLYLIFYKNEKNYFSWSVLFTFFLLDDALLFHENSSSFFISMFNIRSIEGLEYQAIGELLYAGILGLILLGVLGISFYYGSKKFRSTNIDIFLLLALFILCGIGIDILHSVFNKNEYLRYVLGVLEDGGEMLTLSLLTWYFLFLLVRPEKHNQFLYNYFESSQTFLVNLFTQKRK